MTNYLFFNKYVKTEPAYKGLTELVGVYQVLLMFFAFVVVLLTYIITRGAVKLAFYRGFIAKKRRLSLEYSTVKRLSSKC